MSKYENYIETLQDRSISAETAQQEEAYETASDAMAFVQALWDLYIDQGVLPVDSEPDLPMLENLIDAYHGELAAAAIFLAENAFGRVPEVLRATTKTLEGKEGEVVPTVVKKGFGRLANRIEKVRQQQTQLLQVIQDNRVE